MHTWKPGSNLASNSTSLRAWPVASNTIVAVMQLPSAQATVEAPLP